MDITINEAQRLFVIPCAGGYTCAGFDYVFRQLRVLAEKLGKYGINIGPLDPAAIGTTQQYHQYQSAVALIGNRDLGTWFDPDTPRKVETVLETCRKSGERIRIFYGDANTGRDWMEENDVVGRVGRSTGKMKIPLLIPDADCGGPGILDHCIVRIVDARSRRELYRHPQYHLPALVISESKGAKGYTHSVHADGKLQANFKSHAKAAHYVAFIAGETMDQPH